MEHIETTSVYVRECIGFMPKTIESYLLYNHTEVNKGTPPRAYQCAKLNAYTLNSKHEHTCRQPDSEALRARAQRQWNGSGCHELALGSSEGQARFAGRTASKLALAIAGAMRMRLAKLTSSAVP